MYLADKSLDDLFNRVLRRILKHGRVTAPRKGKARELTGVLLKLTNPRARLSLAEKRSVTFSALGELLWYMAKTKSLDFIKYYIPVYAESSDDGRTVHGAYGPRLFDMRGHDQMNNVLSLLSNQRDSRRAAIQLFDAADLARDYKDIPCTCSLQFLVRDDRLHMVTMMRSNDAYLGLPHDVFTFTMIQEFMARRLGVELGTYMHSVGSLHLYERHVGEAKAYLDQGWQEKRTMAPMPVGDPTDALAEVMKAERRLREGRTLDVASLPLADYWKDLVRLLQVYRHFLDGDPKAIATVSAAMASRVFEPLIDYKRRSAARRASPKKRTARRGARTR